MSLLGTIVKKGAKVVDGLLDDTAEVAVKGFDEAAWLAENPRPDAFGVKASDRSSSQVAEVESWRNKKKYAKNRQKRLKKASRWYQSNKEKKGKYDKDYAAQNKEVIKERAAVYRTENAESIKEQNKRYREENLGRVYAWNAKRRAGIGHRIPSWADSKDGARIEEIYEISREAQSITGDPYHVDHVIPLQGKKVSGMHTPDNLLILPAQENLKKNARFEPGDLPPRAGIRNARALLKKLRAEYGITE